MENKSTLKLYRDYKKNIKEQWIDNTEDSKLQVRGRTNTLNLNWRNRHQGKSKQCPTCECEIETLEHFLIECNHYTNIRLSFAFMREMHDISNEDKLKNILAFDTNLTLQEIEIRKKFMKVLWTERRKIQPQIN